MKKRTQNTGVANEVKLASGPLSLLDCTGAGLELEHNLLPKPITNLLTTPIAPTS